MTIETDSLNKTPHTQAEIQALLHDFIAEHGVEAYKIEVQKFPNKSVIVRFSVGFKVKP